MFGNKALENLHVETFVDHVDPTKPYDGTARAMPTDPVIDIDQDLIEPTITSDNKQHTEVLAQAACVRHACMRAPCVPWPLLLPSFSLSSSFFSFFSVFCF